MSLRSRLIISYIVIICVCLLLAFVTFILVARPLQNRLLSRQLIFQTRQAAFRLNTLYRQGVSPDRIVSRLNDLSDQGRTRLLLLDAQGTVLADSQGVWPGQQVPLPPPRDDTNTPQTGTFNSPAGSTILYAVLPVGPEDSRDNYVAAIAPRASAPIGLLAELGWGFIVAGGVAWLVSLVLGLIIARSIALPLQQIAVAAGAVAAGDYEHRLEEMGPLEIKRVAGSFNLMIEQVEASQQAIRDFVSNVSHELKTPLTSIQGFSQAIMEGATQDEAARRRAAGIIYEEAGRMARLVEDLLDLARIDSGQVVMQKMPLDLNQILNGAIERLLPQAAQKQIKLARQWKHLPQVLGDGDRLAQVFTNFLDNAVRHTPRGGRIIISGRIVQGLVRPRRIRPGQVRSEARTTTSERSDFVEVSIADTGPGLSPEDLARIFERFYQVDKSRKRGRGTGLGLAITKEIVEAHGGYVRAESVEGGGARFTVLLPITEADVLTVVSARR
jgi:signal transduction histidine kinase